MQIETERLILDLHRREDFESLTAVWTHPEVVRFIGGKPFTEQECWTRLLRYRGLWPLVGHGFWAVREKATVRYAGDVGFGDFHRASEPTIFGVPEAGWVLAPWAHGKGYATEALTAALAWLDTQQHTRSVCIIDPANSASLRVASKVGYRNPSPIRLGGEEMTLLERSKR